MFVSKKRTQDLLVLIGLGIVAVLTSYAVHATFLLSAFLFLGLPSIYLFLKSKPKNKEALAAALVFGVLYCFLMDFIAELNGAWSWKNSQLVFTNKILGVVSPDAIIWTTLWVILLVLFYEHMIEHDRKDVVSKKIWYVAAVGVIFLVMLILLQAAASPLLEITYSYLILGLSTLLPFIYLLLTKPQLLPKLLSAAMYFVPLYFVYEVVGRSLGQWDFPGQYIGMIYIGTISFPLEEFVFWILLSSVVVLGGYELFIDDGK